MSARSAATIAASSLIESSGADAIYLALAVGDDTPAFIKQARSFGMKQFMRPPLGMPDAMLQALGDDAVRFVTGGLFASWMTEDQNPTMAKFVKDYAASFGVVPSPQAIQGYAGMRMVLAAMDGAKALDTDSFINALANTSIDTVIGKLAVGKEDHQGMVGTYLAEAVKFPQPRYGGRLEGVEDLALGFHQDRLGADGLQRVVNPLRAALAETVLHERGR